MSDPAIHFLHVAILLVTCVNLLIVGGYCIYRAMRDAAMGREAV